MTFKAEMRAENLIVKYGGRTILRGINFEAESRDIHLVIGRNGSGKSTMIRVLAGVIRQASGIVTHREKDISGLDRRQRLVEGIVYVRQKDNVYPDLSVSENLKAAAYAAGKSARLTEMLDFVYSLFPNIKARSAYRAGLMSGGEKQQLAISMGVVQAPEVLLIDEPSAGLSPLIVEELMRGIKEISRSFSVSTVLVEQNVRSACRIATSVGILVDGLLEEVPFNPSEGEEQYLPRIFSKLKSS